MRELTPREIADNEYRAGAALLQQGNSAGAEQHFRLALQQQPAHQAARNALYGVLVQQRRNGDAEQLLVDALRVNAEQPGFAMALARLQVERGDSAAGIETLSKTLASAQGSADYVAFLAALEQREGRHVLAVEHYAQALRISSQNGVWWTGLAMSLHALGRLAEAKEAFMRAKAGNGLNAELRSYVDQHLRQLQ